MRANTLEVENSRGNFGLQAKVRTLVSKAILLSSFLLVSHHPSRKQFFAKLLGVTAAVGFFPKFLAKSAATAAAAGPITGSSPRGSWEVRPDARAVARREGTV